MNQDKNPYWKTQNTDLKLIDRKISFHKPRNPKNGFQSSFLSDKNTKDANSNSNSSSSSKSKVISNELFDLSTIISLTKWEKPRRIGPGLFNLGNTCYLNSTLQCLLYTPPLTQVLLNDSIKVLKPTSVPNQLMIQHFQRLVQDVFSPSTGRSVAPRSMVQHIRQVGKQFRPMRQEDAHEYLRKLIDCMHEEILKQHNVPAKDVKKTETTFIFRIFGGKLRNELLCSKCQYSSKTFNSFLDLSLELSKGVSSVSSAIKAFTQPENLTAGNEWQCEGCKVKVQASKQLTISQGPQVLVLHLKRFVSQGMFNTKINKPIQFTMDFTIQCSGETPSNVDYDLIGLITHLGGSMHSGHYVAFVKAANGQWYEMDDSDISQVSIARVLQQQAYILFYARRSTTTSTSSSTTSPTASSSQVATTSRAVPFGSPTFEIASVEKSISLLDSSVVASVATKKNSVQETVSADEDLGDTNVPTSLMPSRVVSDIIPQPAATMLPSSDEDAVRPKTAIRLKPVVARPFRWIAKTSWAWRSNPLNPLRKNKIEEVSSQLVVDKNRDRDSLGTEADDSGTAIATDAAIANKPEIPLVARTSKLSGGREVTHFLPADAPIPFADGRKGMPNPALASADKNSETSGLFKGILDLSRRGRELGGEGLWEQAGLEANVDSVRALVTQQRREEQKQQHGKRLSEWDQLLDQGRIKKLKPKPEPADSVAPNPFQQVQDRIADGSMSARDLAMAGTVKHKRNHTQPVEWKDRRQLRR